MPVGFLTSVQERCYGRFPDDVSGEQLARYFHLDDADLAFVLTRRGAHMRLGFAKQLGTARFLGTFLEDPCDVPAGVVDFIAIQLGASIDGALATYRASQWRWRHPLEIRERYGYRDFSNTRDRYGSAGRIIRSGHGLAGDAQGFAAWLARVYSNGQLPGCVCVPTVAFGACWRRGSQRIKRSVWTP